MEYRCAECGLPVKRVPSNIKENKHCFHSDECYRRYYEEHPEERARPDFSHINRLVKLGELYKAHHKDDKKDSFRMFQRPI